MMARTGLRSAFLALGLAAALSAQGTAGFSMLPNPAPAGTAFRMYLLGLMVCRDCVHAFTRETVTVNGNRIDVRTVTTSTATPLAAEFPPGSIAILTGQVPGFPMPSLPPGRYEVWVTVVPECLDQKACTIPERLPMSVGSLEVKAGFSASYFLNPGSAPAAKPLDLQILSGGYSCATAFDSLTTEISGDVITLTFHDYERPMGCGMAYEIFGPTFKLPALPAGIYRVKVNRLSKKSVFEAGTLELVGTTALANSPRQDLPVPAARPRAGGPASGSAFQVLWRGHPCDFSGRRGHPARNLEVPGRPSD